MQEGLHQKAPNWQDIAYLDPATVDAEAARLAINDSFSTSASAPHEAPSVDRSFVHKVEEPAALA
jgi:hypothetical protein